MKNKVLFTSLMIFGLVMMLALSSEAQVSSDKEWSAQEVTILNSMEADVLIRIGDVDNLGFGWPEGFDPFCGRMTEVHSYPWEPSPDDLPGMDRILLSSAFNPQGEFPCGGDGYSGSYQEELTKPVAWTIPTKVLKGLAVKNAYLQIFIDDFQAPGFCSYFQVMLNEKRFVEAERFLNAIDQTGPVGKLLSIPVPEEFFDVLTSRESISLKIDESKGTADGWAIDFIRLLVNRKRENACTGDITGKVLDKETEAPVPGARVSLSDQQTMLAGSDGQFCFEKVPTGFEIVTASAPGYADGFGGADVGEGDGNPEVFIYLGKGANARFGDKTVEVGQSVFLNNILFDQGKWELKPASKSELDRVAEFLKVNASAEIELSGHTSSEGDAGLNRSLSYKRVNACKAYVTGTGIDPGRIIAVGFGPDRPVAPNDSEANRAKNRRVEMRIMKL